MKPLVDGSVQRNGQQRAYPDPPPNLDSSSTHVILTPLLAPERGQPAGVGQEPSCSQPNNKGRWHQ